MWMKQISPNAIRKFILHVRGIRDDAVVDIEAQIESDQQKAKGFKVRKLINCTD
jgi:hypothetical protein